MFCPNCGYRNSQGVNFCVRCGASLIADQPDPQNTMNYCAGREPRARSTPLAGDVPDERLARHPQRRRSRRRDLRARGAAHHHRPPPRLRHLSRRRHRLAQPRRRHPRRRRLRDRRPGQPQRHLRQPAAHRTADAARRRRAADRQVQAHVHHAVNEKTEVLFDIGDEKLMTIGAVVDRLKGEFPDISVSKLRYLEEQGLVTPRRTKGGYRLFSRDDYQRLIRVLALQRDEYLPLKVIRKEIERAPAGVAGPAARRPAQGRLRAQPGRRERVHRRRAPAARLGRRRPARRARGVRAHQGPPGQRRAPLHRARGRRGGDRRAPGSRRPAPQEPARHEERRRSRRRPHRAGHAALAALAPPEQRQEALDALEELVQAMSQLHQLLLTRYIRRLTV